MEKIVVLTGDAARDDNLIKCLEIMFPECIIEVKSNQHCKGDQPLSPKISPDLSPYQATDKCMGFYSR